jgi:hypothetical protein
MRSILVILGLLVCQATSAEGTFEDEMKAVQAKRASVAAELADFRRTVQIDTVAQVLNYSDGLPDDGTPSEFWYAFDAKRCIYRKAGIRGTLGAPTASTNVNELKLKSFDRSSIKQSSQKLTYNSPPHVSTQVYIFADGREIFRTEGIDPERALKGWGVIYSKYCTGTVKEF